MTVRPQSVYVALGANQASAFGQPATTLRMALCRMADLGLVPCRISRFFRSPCHPEGAGPDYVNAVTELRVGQEPARLLATLHRVEAEFGRERKQRWGLRVLDLDLLDCGGVIVPNRCGQARWQALPSERQAYETPAELILPHPRLQDRSFVLVPLAEIAPRWHHPVTNTAISVLIAALSKGEVSALEPI